MKHTLTKAEASELPAEYRARFVIDNLEPEMPEGTYFERVLGGYKIHGIEPIQPIALPGNLQSLVKLRAVIDRLLFESEVVHQCRLWNADGFCLSCGLLPCDGNPDPAVTPPRMKPVRGISTRIKDVAKTSATVLAIVVVFLFASPARAQSIGDFVRLVDAVGKMNARAHERPASELRKPCRVGDRIKVEGIWYDCKPRALPEPPAVAGGHVQLTTTKDRLYRTRLNEAAAQPANFMRHWVLTYWGCGTDCIMGAAVDKQSGRVAWLPFFLTEWSMLEAPLPPLVFSTRNGSLFIPHGVLIYDKGAGYAPQTWRLYRGRFVRK